MPRISVDVDLSDVWFEVSDADFRKEAERRKMELPPSAEDFVEQALSALEDGDIDAALVFLRHVSNGTSPPDRKAELAEIAKGKHPFLRARQ